MTSGKISKSINERSVDKEDYREATTPKKENTR